MNMYTFMMATILILAFLMNGHLKGNKRYVWISCILMFCVYAFRDAYSIGIDAASSYIRIFREFGAMEWADLPKTLWADHDVGYAYLNKLVYDLTGGNYQVLIILISAFIMLVFAHLIGKYSCNPVQSFAYYWGLWFFFHPFNILRQCIAMAFVLLSFDQIAQKRPIRFILLVLIGSTFHFPALIFLPAYWIARQKAGLSYLFTLIGMLILTYLFRDQILELMLEFYDTTIYESDMRFLANKVLIMLFIIVAALILRPPKREVSLYNALLQLMGIAVVLQTFASYNNTFERLADYYFQFAVIFIPLVFEKNRVKSLFIPPRMTALAKTMGPYLFGAFGVWRFANYIQNTSWAFLPFRFFFQT